MKHKSTSDIIAGIKSGAIVAYHDNKISSIEFLEELLSDVKPESIPKELFMSWNELSKGNKLKKIKEENPALYAAIYEGEFGMQKCPKDVSERADQESWSIYENALELHRLKILSKMSWDELSKNNLLKELKENAKDIYDDKFNTKFGYYPNSYGSSPHSNS